VALAAVLVLPLLAAGCTSTPEPYFGWDNEPAPRKVAAVKPKPRPHYTANRAACNCTDAPSARPRQKWYDQPADRYDGYDDGAANSSVRFQWPVRGRILAEFGSSPGGEKNNGINIAAADRAPIRAAADGYVSYSGNELRSYGNLVLIKHDNGYVTAYAHADEFIVDKGQWVSRGQVIGYVGMTGDVRSPQLHFEVRRGSRGETPVDPRRMLGSMQVASR